MPSPEEQEEINMRFLQQGSSKPPPRKYSGGRLNAEDDGELAFRVGTDHEKKVVVLDFNKPVVWFAMSPQQAREIGEYFIRRANELDLTESDQIPSKQTQQEHRAKMDAIRQDLQKERT